MPDSTLLNVRRTVADIATSILRFPELRPSQFSSTGVEAIGDLISACDALIVALAERAAHDPEADELLSGVRAQRRLLFLIMAEVNPDHAELWTEASRERERAADAKIAAGLLPRFYADQEFEAALRAQWLGDEES